MSVYMIPIKIAILSFFLLSFIFTIPWLIYNYRKYGFVSIWNSLIIYTFSFYMLSALFLVLLPLPVTQDTCAGQSNDTVYYSIIPFTFVSDIYKNMNVVWTQLHTYSQIFLQPAFYQAAFNFILLLPFGVFLRYFRNTHQSWKKVLAAGFAVSLFFEVTQFTGIYGIYNCPYRIFDVDDLMLNTLGTLCGFTIAPIFLSLLPSKSSIEHKRKVVEGEPRVRLLQQILAIIVDYTIIKLGWIVITIIYVSSAFIEFLYTTMGFVVVYIIIPYIWSGMTLGTRLLKYRLYAENGQYPGLKSLIKRGASLYIPWFFTYIAQRINSLPLDFSGPFYTLQVWISVGIFVIVFIMWSAIFVHLCMIGIRKERLYADKIANIKQIKY
ncbi:VanZ family protein [Bacillus sp. es.036]|uniref:VanZ family protein n=1 Tax=Bacillus sp. es.036 TaxID=1761764 RepID=UPI000BF7CBC2|nr:VanZ family protein [Bacillus sp. es.036]PFG14491.1 glycopeptide antibiotics resistance protein [Bacillus sp. es.036]